MDPLVADYELAPPVGVRVLVVGARAADVVFGCGGTLVHHRAAGDPVRAVLLDAAPGGLAPLVDAVDAWPAALDLGGVQRVYCPSPLEDDPARARCWRAVDAAVTAMASPPEVACYEVAHRLRPNRRVDIGPVLDAKRQALDDTPVPGLRRPREAADQLGALRAADLPDAVVAAEAFCVLRPELLGAGLPALARFALWAPESPPATDQPASLVVRTRDRPQRLREALASVAAQTHRPLEVVLVDSGQTPAPPAELLRASGVSLVVVRRPPGTTRGAALNAGLAAATGRWIGYLDDDDLLYPEHVATLVGALAAGARVAYSDALTVTETAGRRLPPRPAFTRDFSRAALLAGNYIPLHCVMHDAALADEVGPYDEALPGYEDWDMWLRMSARSPFVRVPRVTVEYRIRDRRRAEPTDDEADALDTLRTRYAAERADAWEEAYAELTRLVVARSERLEPLRSELEQLRGKCFGLEQQLRQRDDENADR